MWQKGEIHVVTTSSVWLSPKVLLLYQLGIFWKAFLSTHFVVPDPSFHLHIVKSSSLPILLSNVMFHIPEPMHSSWPALQFGRCRTTPHILCLILTLDKLNGIRFFTLLPFTQKKFKCSELTCLNPQGIHGFSISQPRTQACFYSSHPPSPIFPPFFPAMSSFHVVLSVEPGILVIFIWCSGGIVALIEELFVMRSWIELHLMSLYFLPSWNFWFSMILQLLQNAHLSKA